MAGDSVRNEKRPRFRPGKRDALLLTPLRPGSLEEGLGGKGVPEALAKGGGSETATVRWAIS